MEDVSCAIRRAVPADAEPLAELAARTFRDTFGEDNTPEDMAEHLAKFYGPVQQLAEITSPDIATLLATCEGPTAFAQLRRGRPPACVTSTQTIELWRFYVDKGWHGRGVAKQLMQAVLNEAAAAGVTTVWLGVWERNPRAVAFYRKFGFEDVGAHEFRLGADVQTDRIMVRTLEPSSDIELLRAAYTAFNARDIDAALATMAPDVAWPKAFKGGFARGHQAVRAYWTEQWSEIDPRVEPAAFHPETGGRVLVQVRQVVRDMAGAVIADGHVGHRFTIESGLIRAMEVCPLSDRGT